MPHVIGFHFTLTDQHGNLLEDTYKKPGRALHILSGSGRILPRLEDGLKEMKIGERKTIIIPPEKAYGEVDPSLKLKIPRSKFPNNMEIEIGLTFQGEERDDWPVIYRVTKIDGDDIYADANPDLAGLALNYDVELAEKRKATTEEISHGHVHGPKGESQCGAH